MEITVSGRHLEITPAIREYVEKRVAKLPRYYDRVRAIHVVVEKDTRQQIVEIRVTADGVESFVAKTPGLDLYACIDQTVEKLERQLTDHKEMVRHRMGKTPMSGS
jgi:putative sigma-54 modulation protein